MNSLGFSWNGVNGTCGSARVVLGPHGRVECGELLAWVDYASLHIELPEWRVVSSPRPVYGRRNGPHHRLDVQISTRVSSFRAPPHGIIGQSFSQAYREGKTDTYPQEAEEFTTSAMGEGAIDGQADDYAVRDAFDHDFKFSRFDA